MTDSHKENVQQEKEAAGRAAARLVRDGNVVGLGTGSTAYFTVIALGERVRAGLKIIAVPTSVDTEHLARTLGIPLTTLDDTPKSISPSTAPMKSIPNCNLIKGGGGALTREKVVASASKKMVVVADSEKPFQCSGNFLFPSKSFRLRVPWSRKRFSPSVLPPNYAPSLTEAPS